MYTYTYINCQARNSYELSQQYLPILMLKLEICLAVNQQIIKFIKCLN